jgi:anti-sigma factor ChrR (cupin superfamily)
MSEIFQHGGDARRVEPPATGSTAFGSAALPWEPSGTDGFWIKPLLEDARAGQKTWLMKIDAGAFAPLHAHEELEQIYVLEGTFYDQERSYAAGDFIARAPGAQHTAGSRDGAVLMVIYTPA